MGRVEKKEKKNVSSKKEDSVEKKRVVMSLFILVIMVFSVAGFALMMGGGTGNGDGNTPNEVPFQQFNDQQTGQVFWGAIKNGEQFIFMSIEGYENNTQMANLAEKIKTKQSINVYVDESFKSSDAVFLIEKGLTGLDIDHNRVTEKQCTENTLVLTTNSIGYESCMVFESENSNAYQKADILVYHLITDY